MRTPNFRIAPRSLIGYLMRLRQRTFIGSSCKIPLRPSFQPPLRTSAPSPQALAFHLFQHDQSCRGPNQQLPRSTFRPVQRLRQKNLVHPVSSARYLRPSAAASLRRHLHLIRKSVNSPYCRLPYNGLHLQMSRRQLPLANAHSLLLPG